MDVCMTAKNTNAMSVSTDQPAGELTPTMNAKLEFALGLWLSEMSGQSDQLTRMAARLAQLDNRPQLLKRAA